MNLFAPRADTDNFPELVKVAERVGAIGAAMSATIKAQIDAADSAYRVAETIRHKVVAPIRTAPAPSPRYTSR